MLWAVNCPSGFHSAVCSGLCVGALPRDSSSQVPGRLAGPRHFGDRGQKECPGSALALSFPQGSDKREVRSRTLADCKLPHQYDHRYRGRQDFSVPCAGREISVGGRDVLCYVRFPRSPLAGDFGATGFAGEVGPARSTSNVLSAVAFEDSLVSRIRSALPPGTPVPGGEGGSILVDGVGTSHGGSIRDTCSGSTSVLRRISVEVRRTPPRSVCVRGVVGGGEVIAHQSSRNEGNVSGIAVISGDGRRVTVMCDKLTVVAYVNKQGGTVSRSLCSLVSRLLRWTESLDVHFDARYLPGQSNVLADLLSRRDRVIGTEWSLHPQVVRALLRHWGSPLIDLFATSLNAKLPLYCSLIPNPQAVFEDAFRHLWANLDVYAFPPFPLVGRVVARARETPNLSMTGRPPLAGEGVVRRPSTSTDPTTSGAAVVLRQPHFNRFHHGVHALNLHAWRHSSVSSKGRAFQEDLLLRCLAASGHPLPACTRPSGCSSVVGVLEGALLQSTPLFP